MARCDGALKDAPLRINQRNQILECEGDEVARITDTRNGVEFIHCYQHLSVKYHDKVHRQNNGNAPRDPGGWSGKSKGGSKEGKEGKGKGYSDKSR